VPSVTFCGGIFPLAQMHMQTNLARFEQGDKKRKLLVNLLAFYVLTPHVIKYNQNQETRSLVKPLILLTQYNTAKVT